MKYKKRSENVFTDYRYYIEKELEDNNFLLFTFIDGFGRKQSIELKSVKVTI